MEITKQTVDRLASLAKLSFSEEEKERIIPELSRILSYMEETGENTKSFELYKEMRSAVPLSDSLEIEKQKDLCVRGDIPVPSFDREALLQNAKQRTDTTPVVPKTVEV